MTVWFVPGWMRTSEPQKGVLEAVSNAFPTARVEFRGWDGDHAIWPTAVASADAVVWRLAFEIATMMPEERDALVLVGHSLGGRIVARTLARIGEKGLCVGAAHLLAAAIPFDDPDLALMGAGSRSPVRAFCNPDDLTLKYVYAIAGGEKGAAFGANGTLRPIENVVEHVLPAHATDEVALDASWARSRTMKEIANHHVIFYIHHLGKVLRGETSEERVMVPQDYPTIGRKTIDAGIWWTVLKEMSGWKLEQHRLTRHCRILSDDRRCEAWGGADEMAAAFDKVILQLNQGKGTERK